MSTPNPQMPPQQPLPQPTPATDAVIDALLQTMLGAAQKARSETTSQAFDDWGKGILAMAQAATTLDPVRMAGGVHPDAAAAAAPPVPVKDGDHDGQIGES